MARGPDALPRKHDRLAAEEERDLARRAHAGDLAARDRLVLCNEALVKRIASRRARPCPGLEMADLVQIGMVGLMRAVEGFDPGRRIRFSTYASRWIKGEILHGIEDGGLIRVPTHAHGYLSRLPGPLPPSPREAALAAHAARALGVRSGWHGSPDPDPAPGLADHRGVAGRDGPDGDMPWGEDPGLAARLLAFLPAREARVVRLRHGLDGGPPLSHAGVAMEIGISDERARQVERDAMGRLRAMVDGRPVAPAATPRTRLDLESRGALAEVIAGHPGASLVRLAGEYRERTGRPISTATVYRARQAMAREWRGVRP